MPAIIGLPFLLVQLLAHGFWQAHLIIKPFWCCRNGRPMSIKELMLAFDQSHESINAASEAAAITDLHVNSAVTAESPGLNPAADTESDDVETESDDAAFDDASQTEWYSADEQSSQDQHSESEADSEADVEVPSL